MNSEARRLNRNDRLEQIIQTALSLARKRGSFLNVRRRDIAKELGVSRALISHYLCNVKAIQYAILECAIQREAIDIVAQGLLAKHPAVLEAPDEIRKAARWYLVEKK